MPAIILLAVWKNFGYATLLFVAGLQSIPESLYEAARHGRRRRPGSSSARSRCRCSRRRSSSSGVITTIGYFQFFAEPYVMTDGGKPLNATLSVGLLMYKQGFRWWNMGYARGDRRSCSSSWSSA